MTLTTGAVQAGAHVCDVGDSLQLLVGAGKVADVLCLLPFQCLQFIIEYIGEVLEEEEYLRRKDIYAEVGECQ
jgi:hypothetical protein